MTRPCCPQQGACLNNTEERPQEPEDNAYGGRDKREGDRFKGCLEGQMDRTWGEIAYEKDGSTDQRGN